MACTYELRGHKFSSELELDDFLLSNGHLMAVLGDAVFDNTPAMNAALAQLEKLRKEGEEAAKANAMYKKALVYHDGVEEQQYKNPYIGVTSFLKGLKNGESLMFPDFVPEEYWSRRLGKWSESVDNMTDEEKELFMVMNDGTLPTSITAELAQELKSRIENKWDQQGVIGSCVHKVIELYFTKGLNNPKGFNLLVRKELESFINKEINSNARKTEGKPVYEIELLIPKNSTMINDALEIASKLRLSLENTFGTDIKYFSEFKLSAKLTEPVKDGSIIIGTIDLLVLDSEGNTHIVDFKTSPKNYNSVEYSDVKRSVIRHLLASYNKMLGYNGFNKPTNKMMVVPIQIQNFKPNQDGTYSYTGLHENISGTIFDDLTTQINGSGNSANNNISIYIDVPYVGVFSEDKALQNVKEQFEKWIPNYKKAEVDLTEKEVEKEIEEYGGFDPDEDGNLVYKIPRSEMAPIVVKAGTANPKATLIKKVLEFKKKLRDSSYNTTVSIKLELIKCCEDPNRVPEFPEQKNYGASKAWFEQNMKKYRNGFWKVLDDDKFKFLDTFGIIALQNKINGRVDFVKISLNNLKWTYDFGKGRTILTGAFETDVQQKSKQGTLILESVRGNIELMETMLVINEMADLFNAGCSVGQVMVANPLYGIGVQASNEELLYNFQELAKHSPLKKNNFETERIKLVSKLLLIADELQRITYQGNECNWEDYTDFKRLFDNGSLSKIHDYLNASVEEKIKILEELRVDLENLGLRNKKTLLKNVDYQLDDMYDDYNSLYNNVLIALADLKGISFRQQIRDHDKWFQSAKLLTKGLTGTYIDNPGNLTSDTLNLVTKLTTEAYQNVRIEMQDPVQKFNSLVQNLMKEKNYGILGKRFFENQTNLYENMFDKSYKDDLVLKKLNDSSLSKAEREFMEYFLELVNRERFPREPISKLEEWRDSGDIRYYRVPIKRGDKGSRNVARNAKIEEEGLGTYLKNSLQLWKLSNLKKKFVQGTENLLSDSAENERLISDEEMFKLGSRFDKGDGSERLELIDSIKMDNLERNLETLGIDYLFTHSVSRNINEIFPMIKAAHIHLSMQGANMNLEKGFTEDLDYIDNYVKSVIKGQSILDEKKQRIAKPLSKLKRAASFCTLAFSPVQGLYQSLQGLWNDISLMLRRPDGTDAFKFHNMWDSFRTAWSNLIKPSGKPTLCSRLNELYGLNDMDMNSLVDRLKSDQGGFLHLNNFFMKFATRPDFYNRLTIFGALMRADGSWEAHTITEDGLLQYDWTKDKRFDLFAKYGNNPTGLSGELLQKYNQQKGLYVTMAKQFMKENATVGNGLHRRKFELDLNNPMPLPRAYTTLQSESMKEIADNIYGYYSHEKKSLMHATLLGSMWMQFRTYWSGKKNQYLGTGGIKLRGRWLKQEGLFYNENGEIVKEDTGVPVYMWEGDWQEGIVCTMSDLVKGWADVGLKQSIHDKWYNEDEKLRLIYRNNIKQLGIDISMFSIGGLLITGLLANWLKDFEKEKKEEDTFINSVQLAAAKIAVQSVRTSFIDFNFFNSIGDPLASWTPFAADWAQRTVKNSWRVINGNEDLWDGLLNTFSAGKLLKPALSTIKPSMFKTESEGGTFVPRRERKKEA